MIPPESHNRPSLEADPVGKVGILGNWQNGAKTPLWFGNITARSMKDARGVSFVIPVHNGERWLDDMLAAILAQADGRPMEVIIVEDHSIDRSAEILHAYARAGKIRLLSGEGRGAAAAINLGIRHAVHPIICQVDQDVILRPGWMTKLAAELSADRVAAAQGYYLSPRDGTIWARVMGLDLKQRYDQVDPRNVDHVCTGNTAYDRGALEQVGLFDEALGYGYDNDISYRLVGRGYRLVLCRAAESVHEWREGFKEYFLQQYGFGYGRLDLMAKHRRRVTGDDVSRVTMILHAPVMLLILLGLIAAPWLAVTGRQWQPVALVSGGLLFLLAGDRSLAGLRAAIRFREPAGLYFAPVHLVRDTAWAFAVFVWCGRRMLGRGSRPSDSMYPRTSEAAPQIDESQRGRGPAQLR